MGKSDSPEKKAVTAKAPAKAKAIKAAPVAAEAKPLKKAAVAKVAAVKAPKKAAPALLAPPPAPSIDDIALRAYFISEKRQQLGLPGDSDQDWIEAQRQLVEEAKAKKPLTKKAVA
jgi:hypothetical protein